MLSFIKREEVRHILLAVVFVIMGMLLFTSQASSQTGTAMTGYAWSDTIGWISFNCLNTGTCASRPYGITVATDGTLSGYAWSDNIGWISANTSELSGCPTVPCTARITSNAIKGWFKALAGSTASGWDGWISLSGSNYGPTLSSGTFSGYGWGSTVVGWTNFSYARTAYAPCQATNFCVGNDLHYIDAQCVETVTPGACTPPPSTPSGALRALPKIVVRGNTTHVLWEVENANSCTVTGTNGDSWSGISGDKTSSPIGEETTYTLICAGEGGSLEQTVDVLLAPQWQEV